MIRQAALKQDLSTAGGAALGVILFMCKQKTPLHFLLLFFVTVAVVMVDVVVHDRISGTQTRSQHG